MYSSPIFFTYLSQTKSSITFVVQSETLAQILLKVSSQLIYKEKKLIQNQKHILKHNTNNALSIMVWNLTKYTLLQKNMLTYV
jgi:hypothetical protein